MRPLRIATWNINSVRLRLPLLKELVAALEPDVLCLQETKCPDELFPREALRGAGLRHVALSRHEGLQRRRHPVAPAVRAARRTTRTGAARAIAGISAWSWTRRAGRSSCTISTSRPAATSPTARPNPKFGHKLDFVAEATHWFAARGPARRARHGRRPQHRAAGARRLEHKQLLDVVSHTPVEIEALTAWQRAGGWHDAVRHFVPADQKLYTWWSYRARDWEPSDRGRRLDHVWVSQDLAGKLSRHAILKPARGWPQASDHVPVMVELAP